MQRQGASAVYGHNWRRAWAVATAIGLAAICASTVGRAQPVSRDLAIRAVVPKFCTVAGRLAPIDVPISIGVDAEGVVTVAPPAPIAAVVCNAAAGLTVASLGGGARFQGPAAISALSQTDVVHWRAEVAFGPATVRLDTARTVPSEAAAITSGPAKGAVAVTLAAGQTGKPLAAGNYRDTLRILLVPR